MRTDLVVCGKFLTVRRDVTASSLGTHNNLVLGPLVVLHGDNEMADFRSLNSSLAILRTRGSVEKFLEFNSAQTYLTMFARSAPEKPGVPRARTPTSTSGADLMVSM